MFGRNLPARRDIPNNPGYITATKECLEELSAIGITLCYGTLLETIPVKFENLKVYLEKNENNFSLEVIRNSISFVKAADIRTEMEHACVGVMEMILSTYSNKFLPMIFDSIPEAAHLQPKFILSQSYITQESLNGQNALRRNLSPIYSELAEMMRIQEQLISTFSQLQITRGDGSTDWGNEALDWGAAALVLVNPIMGVSACVARMYGNNKKNEANNAFLRDWGVRYVEYFKCWEKLNKSYETVYLNQCGFIEDKWRNISERAIPNILSELDAQGFNLKKVPLAYQKFLTDFKHDITQNKIR